ncbi:Zinc finger and SCAN domain-containing protein 9 [Frankliniella fusca]|uniref:Zinc finger and SCAN domain-containing protein 9 n=1 Tax=Frankliniella fusca TaxID=407009 RepID=A0AAE1LJ11_9NEOP|nr:Zinc finger and SCAN domain-containing protein 9 [Frankliniella fusca]
MLPGGSELGAFETYKSAAELLMFHEKCRTFAQVNYAFCSNALPVFWKLFGKKSHVRPWKIENIFLTSKKQVNNKHAFFFKVVILHGHLFLLRNLLKHNQAKLCDPSPVLSLVIKTHCSQPHASLCFQMTPGPRDALNKEGLKERET